MRKRHLYKELPKENNNNEEETNNIDELWTNGDEKNMPLIKFQGNRLKDRRGGVHIENGKLLTNDIKFYVLMGQLKHFQLI